jgi:hypothetical protein
MQSFKIRKIPVLLLILFLLLWVPSIQAHTLHVTQDTYNNSAMVNDGNGGETRVHVNDQNGTEQGFAQFDLSTLPSGTTGADIEKATFRLFVRNVMTPGDMDVHLVTSSWDEATLSFNNSPTLNATPFASDVAFIRIR